MQEQTSSFNPAWPVIGSILLIAGVCVIALAIHLILNLVALGDQSTLLAHLINTGPLSINLPNGSIQLPLAFSRTTSIGLAIWIVAIISGIGKSLMQAGVRLITPEYQIFIKALRETIRPGPPR